MRKIVIALAVIVVAGGASAGWLFLHKQPTPAPKNNAPPVSESKKATDPKEHNLTDADFARKMIIHSQQGIQIADIAKVKATSEPVRQEAARISDELTSDTQQYISWLTDWKETYNNLSDFPQMEGHDMYPALAGMAKLSDIDALKSATGSSVDELFLRLMIAHHQGAIELESDPAYQDMQFGQLLTFKAEAAKKQTVDIQTMKQLQIQAK